MTENANYTQEQNIRRSRRMSVIVLVVILLPMMAAFFIYKTGMGLPSGRVNRGELLTPASSIKQINFRDSWNESLNLLAGSKKWRIFIPGYRNCNDKCRQILYLTRQVHIRLAEQSHRVERVYINFENQLDPEVETLFTAQHPGLRWVYTSHTLWRQWLANTNAPRDPVAENSYFLVDQEGYAMMFYSSRHKGNDLLEDLKHLLKYSYKG